MTSNDRKAGGSHISQVRILEPAAWWLILFAPGIFFAPGTHPKSTPSTGHAGTVLTPTLLKPPAFLSLLVMPGPSWHLLAYFTEFTDFFIITGHAGIVLTSIGLFYWNNHRLFHNYWSCRERLYIYLPTLDTHAWTTGFSITGHSRYCLTSTCLL